MENINFVNDQEMVQRALEKSRKFGLFSLTAEDHTYISSTPDERLKRNPGKALYEILSDKEIEDCLNMALNNLNDTNLISSGQSENDLDFIKKSIAFLKSVKRLPKKFETFEI